jgi:hypothetical protein
VNPALTIAAQALRVSEHIAETELRMFHVEPGLQYRPTGPA